MITTTGLECQNIFVILICDSQKDILLFLLLAHTNYFMNVDEKCSLTQYNQFFAVCFLPLVQNLSEATIVIIPLMLMGVIAPLVCARMTQQKQNFLDHGKKHPIQTYTPRYLVGARQTLRPVPIYMSENLLHTCLQSHLQSTPLNPKNSYPKFWDIENF